MRHTGLAFALALIAACRGSDPITGPDSVQTSGVRLYGVVVESSMLGGTRPVTGAIVEAAGARTTTMADGTYSIRIVTLTAGAAVTVMVRRGDQVAERELRLEQDTRADFTLASVLSVLSGIVYEVTGAGRVPVEKVHVENSNNHESTLTDSDGRYRLSFIEDSQATLFVNKAGYRVISQLPVVVRGDQTLDIEMVRTPGGM